LFGFWAGAQSVELSKAESLDPNQPRIVLQSPTPIQVYNSSSIELSLEIVKPSSWFYDYGIWDPSATMPFDPTRDVIRGYGCYGRIDYIECSFDGKINQTFPIDDYTPHDFYKNQMTTKLRFSQSLGVAEGRHFLKITAFCSFYPDRFGSFYSDSYSLEGRTRQSVNCSVETSFLVWYTNPEISLISPQSATYGGSDVPLTFEVDRPAVCVYSLDGADNISLTGNTTLMGLAEGPHSLVVYATDAAGNIGKSEGVFFEVASTPPVPTPQPTPEPTPSPSPPPAPSLIETATPKPTVTSSPSSAATPPPSSAKPFLSGTALATVIVGIIIFVSAVVVLVLAKRRL
ncbi:MAG: hypothetical protein NWF05_12155, partial [Candidatus Bathyarchaeota archaeon]|nr:hypothetical protein [Candidatus Bathyarchaeota archaeon]